MPRNEKKLPGCLLQSGTTFPQRDIVVCGLCPARATDVGNLGEKCVKVPQPS